MSNLCKHPEIPIRFICVLISDTVMCIYIHIFRMKKEGREVSSGREGKAVKDGWRRARVRNREGKEDEQNEL